MYFYFCFGDACYFLMQGTHMGQRTFFTCLIVVGLIGWLKVSTETDSDIWGVLVIHVGADLMIGDLEVKLVNW